MMNIISELTCLFVNHDLSSSREEHGDVFLSDSIWETADKHAVTAIGWHEVVDRFGASLQQS